MVTYEDLAGPVLSSLLSHGSRHRPAAPHGLIRVWGPEAADYLHRLCSQDVLAMAAGQARPAAFLDGKGKLKWLVLLGRVGESDFYLATQGDRADGLREMLELYHFSEKLEIEQLADWKCEEGWASAEQAKDAAGCCALDDGDDGRQAVTMGWDHHGLVRTLRFSMADAAASVESDPLTEQEAECLRILAGIPLVGIDTEERTLALEAPIDDHISTTKGCYTGQEIVARIHTYGHTNRSLCLLGIDSQAEVAPGTNVCEPEDGDPVGRVMSSVPLPVPVPAPVPAPGGPSVVALGFLAGALAEVGTELRLGDKGGAVVQVLR